MRRISSQNGLTLLETLVAMTILTIILGVIYSTFFSASKTSRLLEADEDVYQTARSLLGLLSRDLRALQYIVNPATQKGFGLRSADSEHDDHGTDGISFLTSSYQRTRSDSPAVKLAEVRYFFDIDPLTGEKQFVRVEDPTVDFDFDEGGLPILLTDRVEEINITFLDGKQDLWLDEWDLEKLKKLPDLIRIELSVLNEQDEATRFETTIGIGANR